MDLTPIDVMGLAEYYLDDAKKAHRKAKEDAEDFLAAKRMSDGTTSLESPLFGGEYHYGKTRPKEVTEFKVANENDFEDWVYDNGYPLFRFLKARADSFCREWVEENGEVPAGIEAETYTEPARETPPKLYKFDVENVKRRLGIERSFSEQLESMASNLLGDGE